MNFTPALPLLLLPLLAPSPSSQVDAVSLVSSSARPAEAASDSEVKLYDLRSLGLRRQELNGHYRLLPASVSPQDPETESEGYDALSVEDIMSTLERLCGDEFEFEGRAIWESREGVLAVRAPASVQARVEKLLEMLSNSVGRRVAVRVDVISHRSRMRIDESLLGVVDAAGVEELRRSGTGPGASMQTYMLDLVPGEESLLDLSRFHEFLGSYEVEVAQSAFAFDPRMIDMISGTRLSMSCSPVAGGLGVSVVLRSGTPTGPPRRIDLQQKGFASNENSRGFMDGPRYAQAMSIDSRSFAFESAIPEGGALSFQSTLSLDEAQGTQIFVLTPQGEALRSVTSTATTGSEPDVFAVNTGSFAPERLQFSRSRLRAPNALRFSYFDDESMLAVSRDGIDFGSSWDYLESQCPDLILRENSGWIIATRDREAAQELKEAGIQPASIESAVRAITERAETVHVSLKLSRSGDGLSQGLSLDVPLLIGQESVVSMGVEGTRVHDYDVEIAQGSSVSQPKSVIYLDGLVLTLDPRRRPNGDLSLRLSGLAQLLRQRDFFEPDSPMFRGMDQLLFDRLAIEQVVTLEQGKGSFILGDQSSNAPIGSLRLDIVVR